MARTRGVHAVASALLLLLLLATVTVTVAVTGQALEFDDPRIVPAPHQTKREHAAVDTIAVGALFSQQYLELSDDDELLLGGRGRSRSDGISITRAMAESDRHPMDQMLEDGAVVFDPDRIDLGLIATCLPTISIVEVVNNGSRPWRIDDAWIEHSSFTLSNNPRYIVLDPGQKISLTIYYLGRDPGVIDTYLFLSTTAGMFAVSIVGHVRANDFDAQAIRTSMPPGASFEIPIRLTNPSNELMLISEIFTTNGDGQIVLPHSDEWSYPDVREEMGLPDGSSLWEIPPGQTKTVARFLFTAAPDVSKLYRSVLHISSSLVHILIPVEMEVFKDELRVEPTDVDIGVFTNNHERRDVVLSLHNTAPRAVAIRELIVTDSYGMEISATLQGPTIVPAYSRIKQAITIQARRMKSGHGHATLFLKTNATIVQHPHHTIRLRGFSMHGHLAVRMKENVINIMGVSDVRHNTTAANATVSGVVNSMPGTPMLYNETMRHEIRLRNRFDRALELERVWKHGDCGWEFVIEDFKMGVVGPGETFPDITVRVSPSDYVKNSAEQNVKVPRAFPRLTSRTCMLAIETNASTHHVPVFMHHGITRLSSTRRFQEHSSVASKCPAPNITITTTPPPTPSTWQEILPSFGSKLCRSMVLDIGKITTTGSRVEKINVTNVNPVALHLEYQDTRGNASIRFNSVVRASVTPDPRASVDMAMIGAAWTRRATLKAQTSSETSSKHMIPPGHALAVVLRITMLDLNAGEYLDPVLVLETEFEVVHVLMRYEAVDGHIYPDKPHIIVPPTHPGQAGVMDLFYHSTVNHNAAVVRAVVNGEGVGLRKMPVVLPGNATSRVSVFLFPPKYYEACRSGRFYARCFVYGSKDNDDEHESFSDFGELVTQHDLDAWRKRFDSWTVEVNGEQVEQELESHLVVATDVMEVASIKFSIPLVRPKFLDTNHIEFSLTETHTLAQTWVNVHNPSDYVIHLELAISTYDQDMFYICDHQLTESECLQEWQNLEPSAELPNGRPPFCFRQQLHRVAGRHRVQLGPIYFVPTIVENHWSSQFFVRNELTHIESLWVTASSGEGVLAMALLTSTTDDHRKSQRLSLDDFANMVSTLDGDGKCKGEASSAKCFDSYSSTQLLELTNEGRFNVELKSIQVVGSSESFSLSLHDQGLVNVDAIGPMVIQPQERVVVGVTFNPNCIHTQTETTLELETRRGTTHLHLTGDIPESAAFECRRARATATAREWLRMLWQVAVVVASAISVVAITKNSLFFWKLWHRDVISQPVQAAFESTEVTAADVVKDPVAQDSLRKLSEMLEALEQTLSVPSGSVTTPAVEKLLTTRRAKENLIQSKENEDVESLVTDTTSSEASGDVPSSPEPVKSSQSAGEVEPPTNITSDAARVPLASPATAGSSAPQDNQDTVRRHASPLSKQKRAKRSKNKNSKAEVDNQEASPFTPALPITQDTPLHEKHVKVKEEAYEDNQHGSQGEEREYDASRTLSRSSGFEAHQGNQESYATHRDDKARDDEHQDQQTTSSLRPFALSADDEWNDLSFESLQSEIGKLLVTGDTTSTVNSQSRKDSRERHTASAFSDGFGSPAFALSGDTRQPATATLHPAISSSSSTAPPGFTPEDANPEASRAAFERLFHKRPGGVSAHQLLFQAESTLETGASTAIPSAFSGRYSLFGPTLASAVASSTRPSPAFGFVTDDTGASGVGSIGSSRSQKVVSDDVFSALGNHLATLGGVELTSPSNRKRV
ncbi:hypothetical protein Poli38472_006346 [Pythium oligandrum]|uniref:TMEM131 second Ig-like domain-containing protein n=1 Tax=Pythium oligandrum TaxID=41045 RepID=A0A8K1C4L1_PYTOL|nr:hypothetical protein Poli38472_006346 [Pythium oligandrum]|eukprot:TMW56336.1 hypothetical protein Poli38472_006346 [Pythium oligandrum]